MAANRKFPSLEAAVFDGCLADAIEYVTEVGHVNGLFDDRRGGDMSVLQLSVVSEAKVGVELMLECGADPNLKNSRGETALFKAILYGDIEIVQVLPAGGADPNLQIGNGDTPLHAAIGEEKAPIARLLRKHGADPDIPNEKGITARQLAMYMDTKKATQDLGYSSLRDLL